MARASFNVLKWWAIEKKNILKLINQKNVIYSHDVGFFQKFNF